MYRHNVADDIDDTLRYAMRHCRYELLMPLICDKRHYGYAYA